MKNVKRIILLAAIALMLFGVTTVNAETQSTALTASQISDIQNNCTTIQSSLRRVRDNDTLARLTLGQEYETISSLLMAPMNSRFSLNKLDGVKLTQITVAFNAEFERFRGTGGLNQQYQQLMSNVLDTDCHSDPIGFYTLVANARAKRQEVTDSVTMLNNLIAQYRAEIQSAEDAQAQNPGGGA